MAFAAKAAGGNIADAGGLGLTGTVLPQALILIQTIKLSHLTLNPEHF